MSLNRRQWLLSSGAALLSAGHATRAFAASAAPKKVLFFTKSSGFPHSVVTRQDGQPAHAERILTELGQTHGFEVVASKDGRLFDPDKIGQWDAFVFETTGDLTTEGTDKQPPMSSEGERAFYEAIRGGKGFVGIHCATDTFGHHRNQGPEDPYIQLIGGEFVGHGKQQEARIRVVDPAFPGASSFGRDAFMLNDEWYAQKNLASDLHVIFAQVTEEMDGTDYDRPDYPETWARMHGEGRVFYTSMGHREDVWENPKFQGLLIGALSWVTGQADADVEPNVSGVTPGYQTLGTRPVPKTKARAKAKG